MNKSPGILAVIGSGFGAGSAVGLGLLIAVALVKDVRTGLEYSSYCACCGAVAGGMMVARLSDLAVGFVRLLGAAVGAASVLAVIGAAWYSAPLFGLDFAGFPAGSATVFGLICGFVGTRLHGRRTRLIAQAGRDDPNGSRNPVNRY